MVNKNFCKKMKAMIQDEKSAPREYKALVKASGKGYIRSIVAGISAQERNHYKKDKAIYRKECK